MAAKRKKAGAKSKRPPKEVPRLSPSIGHVLTTQYPLAAWGGHRLLGNFRKATTASQAEGRLWHAAILEAGADIEVVEVAHFKSKDAQQVKEQIEARGNMAVAASKWDAMAPGVHRIKEELARFGIPLDGVCEERVEWTEYDDDGRPVECSGVLDHRKDYLIQDLKTGSAGLTEDEATNLIGKSHALLQDAAYKSAIATLHEVDLERMSCEYVFVQTEEPHAILPIGMSGALQEISFLRWRWAINLWSKCLRKGMDRKHWPGPVAVGHRGTALPPSWMLAQELEREAMR